MIATEKADRGPQQHWLARFLHRPQQTLLRRACFQVHLWAGVLLSLYICAIGVSGSILVFKDELTPRPARTGAFNGTEACTPETLVAALGAAERAYPARKVVLASCPIAANAFYQIHMHAAGGPTITVYVEPQSNRVAGGVDLQNTWIEWVDRFHIDLLITKNGRQWNGAGALALVVLVITGLVIWWPGIRNWARGLSVDFRRSWKRINYDLHSAIGIWTIVFVFTWALTGVYFAWEAPFERAIRALSPITTAAYPSEAVDRLESRAVPAVSGSLDLESVLHTAISAVPDARLEGLFFGSGKAPLLTVYMAHGAMGDYANTAFLYFDQLTGKLLYVWHRGENHTLGDWLLWLSVPLHFGTSFGMAGKIVWAAAGLVLPLLAITGAVMYWNRWLSKRVAALTRKGA
jgi:uncharacterized iron-regulated membrane protein